MTRHAPVDSASALQRASAAPGHPAAIAELLEIQFHHLGRDATHREGNLLRRVGFVRQPAPPGLRTGVSRYVAQRDGRTIAVWPFALFTGGADGAAIVPRRGQPSWLPVCGLPDVFTLRAFRAVRQRSLPCPAAALADALAWLVGYERAIGSLVGDRHRIPAEERARGGAAATYLLDRPWRTHVLALRTRGGTPAPRPATPTAVSRPRNPSSGPTLAHL